MESAGDAMTAVSLKERAELFRALGALVEEPAPEHVRLAELLGLPGEPGPGAFTELFGLNLYPYASVYLGEEGMLGGEARDRVAGFWGALGMLPPPEPDHLGALLGLLAGILEREGEEEEPAAALLLGRARGALLREHLMPWLPPFLAKVEELAGDYHTAWAQLLLQALEAEARSAWEDDQADVADTAHAERAAQRILPLHLRDIPPLPDPRVPPPGVEEGMGEDFLKALLAPVRSGIILTRRDLVRAGNTLELGVRQGERRYILKALLGQDPGATLRWLAEEACRWVDAHRRLTHDEPWRDTTITTFWEARAEASARLLGELAGETYDA